MILLVISIHMNIMIEYNIDARTELLVTYTPKISIKDHKRTL